MRKKSKKNSILLMICTISLLIIPFTTERNNFHSTRNSCTIFTVTSKDNDIVYFCNNEDYFPDHMRMYFFPATEGKYGKVLYGFTYQHGFNPLGGMNDQGLSADENWVPSTTVKRDPNKIDYIRNNVFTRILEECSTVAEVIEWIKNYNLVQLESYPCQVHFADKTGDAAIFGIDTDGKVAITRKAGNYLLSTNFNVAQGRKECWRYDTAEEMLQDMKEVSIEYCLSILKATHQGRFTRYSNINDLKNGILYFHTAINNYEGMASINLEEELSKGFHSYDILTLILRKGNVMPQLPFVLSSIIVFTCIMLGCALIWIYKIRPEILKKNGIPEGKKILKEGNKVE